MTHRGSGVRTVVGDDLAALRRDHKPSIGHDRLGGCAAREDRVEEDAAGRLVEGEDVWIADLGIGRGVHDAVGEDGRAIDRTPECGLPDGRRKGVGLVERVEVARPVTDEDPRLRVVGVSDSGRP